jgi:Flp pilus assembly pilin Flp
MDILRRCYADESGQDIIEYSLLLVFVVLCSAALLFSGQASINGIWTTTNNNLASAKSMAS